MSPDTATPGKAGDDRGDRTARDPTRGDGRSLPLAAFVGGLREYRRTPLLLALVAFLPAYFVLTFTYLIPETAGTLAVPGEGLVQVTLNDAYTALLAPMAAALVAAIAGLFLMRSTRAADARLVVAGGHPAAVALARFGLLAVVAVVAAAVATGVALVPFAPERPGWFFGAVLLAALSYGLVGVLVGVVLDRLTGVHVVLFGSMIDLFILQNPLAETADYATYLPGHAPVELAVDAGFSSGVALDTVGQGLAVVAVLAVAVVVVLRRAMSLE